MSEDGKRDPEREAEKYWLDEPKNVDKIVYGLYAVCAVLLFGVDFFYDKHPHFELESWHGFYAWFGLVGSVSLVLVSKLMRRVLMRGEDYYGDASRPDEAPQGEALQDEARHDE